MLSENPTLTSCITFDVDLVEYAKNWRISNEFESAIPAILSVLRKYPNIHTTWYIRLDNQIAELFGSCDFFFKEYFNEFNVMKKLGHELGWHPHTYVKKNHKWEQNIEISSVLSELLHCAPIAHSYCLKTVRMGWGFQSNETMQFLNDQGFFVDSSAIPRPNYPWEETYKDWTTTPAYPYFPSKGDYRVPGKPSLPILEVPISVTSIRAPYDKENIQRYINLAYHPNLLQDPLHQWIQNNSHLVTITHPYECFPTGEKHGLLAYSIEAFEKNIFNIMEISKNMNKEVSFITLSEFAEKFKQNGEVNA